MAHLTFETLCTVLLASSLSAAVACESANTNDSEPASATASASATAPSPSPSPSPNVDAPAPQPSASPELALAPMIDEQPVLASTNVSSIELPLEHAEPPLAQTQVDRKRNPHALRSPSLVPAGTPEEHIAAFTNLRVGSKDKQLVGGVGATGIHLDELEVGHGWASSRCEELGQSFAVGDDERVNVCFRVVHQRVDETVTLEWARDGKVRQTIDLHIQPTHAYLTRAWMPVSAGRTGEWTATVKSEDGSVLGQVAFEIE